MASNGPSSAQQGSHGSRSTYCGKMLSAYTSSHVALLPGDSQSMLTILLQSDYKSSYIPSRSIIFDRYTHSTNMNAFSDLTMMMSSSNPMAWPAAQVGAIMLHTVQKVRDTLLSACPGCQAAQNVFGNSVRGCAWLGPLAPVLVCCNSAPLHSIYIGRCGCVSSLHILMSFHWKKTRPGSLTALGLMLLCIQVFVPGQSGRRKPDYCICCVWSDWSGYCFLCLQGGEG